MKDLEKAVNGEYSAIHCYATLANLATEENIRKQMLEIRQDEMKHFQQFEYIYMSLTERRPQQKMIERCPNDYKSGLELALQDKQQTNRRFLFRNGRSFGFYTIFPKLE